MLKHLRESRLWCYVMIAFGVLFCIAGLNFFLLPGRIAAGGFTGLATVLYYLLKLPIGATLLALNIPLFLFAFKRLGRNFALKTLYGLGLYSVLADIVPVIPLTEDYFLAAVYGGVLMGLGVGLTLYFGGSTGGADVVAKLLHDRFRFIGVGICLFLMDFIVILAAGIVFDMHSALFAIISVYVSTKMVELITEGLGRAKAFMIISSEYEAIEREIMQTLRRGVTEFTAKGAYSRRDTVVLLCMVERGAEVVKLKTLVERIDEKAFIIAWEAKEVSGEGFSYPRSRPKQVEIIDGGE